VRNASQRSRFRTHLKKVARALHAKDKENATAAYRAAVPIIDSMVGKGFIHKNQAARRKRRLNARIKALAAGA
jgi:small subunit ribosomal protein S20